MTRRPRPSAAVREGRNACEREFEPLWKPAPWTPIRPGASALERADMQEAAKRTAFAWLAHQLNTAPFASFRDIDDLELLRRAYAVIARATIKHVRAWSDQMEAQAA